MKPLFPADLLSKSSEDCIEYFDNCRVAHPKLTANYKKLSDAIRQAKPGSLIVLLGPAGVGKTTTLNRLLNDSISSFSAESNPGCLPIIMVEAVKGDRDFNWKDYYKRVLSSLYDPITDRKVNYQNWEILPTEISDVLRRENKSAAVYRQALEKALAHRRPKAVLIDEAQHIAATRTGIATLDQLNLIKSRLPICRERFTFYAAVMNY